MTGHRLRNLSGTVCLIITGAAPEEFLNRLAAEDIPFRELSPLDELTLFLEVPAGKLEIVRRCAKQTMCTVEVRRVRGIVPLFAAMGWRLGYPLVLLSLAALVFWLQGHIWFFTVRGNETVPDQVILRALEDQGVGFFVNAGSLDMNQVKNRVLSAVPELGWITLNFQGGTAEVVVRERQTQPAISREAAPAHLTAGKGGLIETIDATAGTPQVRPGDVVEAGDVLISGVTELEWTTLITRAEGEIYARTWNTVAAALPEGAAEKRPTGRETACWSLTIGKKTINFYKTSGISYREYDTIKNNTVLALPGGYRFPVTLTRRTFREYAAVPIETDQETARSLLTEAADRQMEISMRAGTILDRRLTLRHTAGGWLLRGILECREEIGTITEIGG